MGVRFAVAAVVAAVLIVVGFHVMMAEGQLQLDRLDAATKTEQQRYEQLRLKYAQRSSPEAIIERADRIGMIPATSQRYLSVPGLSEHDSTDDGSGAVATSAVRDWEKVKKHLVERP
jgi:hypothetical protein